MNAVSNPVAQPERVTDLHALQAGDPVSVVISDCCVNGSFNAKYLGFVPFEAGDEDFGEAVFASATAGIRLDASVDEDGTLRPNNGWSVYKSGATPTPG